MKSDLVVTLIQFDPVWEDPPRNRNKLDDLFSSLSEPTDVIILPEMFSTGFTMNASSMAESMDGSTLHWMSEKAAEMSSDIVGSIIIKEGDHYFNRLIWMGPEGIRTKYDKRHLFGMAGEDKVFTAGREKILVDIKGWRICPFICYDLRFPVWSRNEEEADVLLYVACFPEKRHYAWQQLLLARAIENQSYVIGVNRVGWDGKGHLYAGDSVVVDPLGSPVVKLGDKPAITTYSMPYSPLEDVRYTQPFLQDRDKFEIEL